MSSGRRTRTDLILKLINLLKSEELAKDKIFQQVELTSLEAALKEDLGRHPWFHNLLNVLITESCPVSEEELQLYQAATASGTFDPAEYQDVKEEVQHLQSNLKKLRNHMSYLQEKYAQLVKMKSNEKETKLITAELRVKALFQEVQHFVDKDSSVIDPYENVSQIVEKSNEYFKDVSQLDMDKMLDKLALASWSQRKEDLLVYFLQNLKILFLKVHEKLDQFRRHCENLRFYFSVNMKKDILWRGELNSFISELDKCPSIQATPSIRPNTPQEAPDIESCWKTVENIRHLNSKYLDYTDNLNQLMDKIKSLIDLSLKHSK